MDGFNIVMVIAIILFASLGARLFYSWRNYKNDTSNKEDKPSSEE